MLMMGRLLPASTLKTRIDRKLILTVSDSEKSVFLTDDSSLWYCAKVANQCNIWHLEIWILNPNFI
jgi:hypothetical protein